MFWQGVSLVMTRGLVPSWFFFFSSFLGKKKKKKFASFAFGWQPPDEHFNSAMKRARKLKGPPARYET